jgi:hypothetical protein
LNIAERLLVRKPQAAFISWFRAPGRRNTVEIWTGDGQAGRDALDVGAIRVHDVDIHRTSCATPKRRDQGNSQVAGPIFGAGEIDGQEIVYIGLEDSKQPRSLITMPGFFRTGAVSPDGRRIIANVGETKSDVWLMNNFDPQTSRAKQPPD